MSRMPATFTLTCLFFAIVILGLLYKPFGVAIIAAMVFVFFWVMIDNIFGHHWEKNDAP